MNQTKPIPVVGQILQLLSMSNRHSDTKTILLQPVRVVSIGRKYFKVIPQNAKDTDTYLIQEVHLDTWCHNNKDYTPNFRLYLSPQEYENEKEIQSICEEIYRNFQYNSNSLKLSLEALRQIKILMDSAKQKS